MEKVKYYLKKLEVNFNGVLLSGWFGVTNPWGGSSFTTIDGTMSRAIFALNFFINISGLVAVCIIVYGAITLIVAAGRDDYIERGMNTIQAGIVGLVIIFVAGTAVRWMLQTFF